MPIAGNVPVWPFLSVAEAAFKPHPGKALGCCTYQRERDMLQTQDVDHAVASVLRYHRGESPSYEKLDTRYLSRRQARQYEAAFELKPVLTRLMFDRGDTEAGRLLWHTLRNLSKGRIPCVPGNDADPSISSDDAIWHLERFEMFSLEVAVRSALALMPEGSQELLLREHDANKRRRAASRNHEVIVITPEPVSVNAEAYATL